MPRRWVLVTAKQLVALTTLLSLLGLHAQASGGDQEFCNALIKDGQPGVEHIRPLANANVDMVWSNLRKNNKDMYFDSVQSVYSVDIDNDGKPDNVATTLQGSAHGVGFVIYDDHWKDKSYTWLGFPEDETTRWSEFSYLARYKNKTYVVWNDSSGRFLSHVSSFDKAAHNFICRFDYTSTARTTIARAKDKSLCEALLNKQVTYATFSLPNKLQSDHCYESGGPSCALPSKTSAQIDINNDGKNEPVVKMQVAWGGGRGCDFTFLAITNEDGENLQESDTNQTLMTATQKWGTCGGVESLLFRYKGMWYIENRYPDHNVFDFHNVLLIQSGKTQEICLFSVVRTPRVVQ